MEYLAGVYVSLHTHVQHGSYTGVYVSLRRQV